MTKKTKVEIMPYEPSEEVPLKEDLRAIKRKQRKAYTTRAKNLLMVVALFVTTVTTLVAAWENGKTTIGITQAIAGVFIGFMALALLHRNLEGKAVEL